MHLHSKVAKKLQYLLTEGDLGCKSNAIRKHHSFRYFLSQSEKLGFIAPLNERSQGQYPLTCSRELTCIYDQQTTVASTNKIPTENFIAEHWPLVLRVSRRGTNCKRLRWSKVFFNAKSQVGN